jgi:hypothetical protein
MRDLIFLLKIMGLTFVVVIILQIKVGEDTLEDRAMRFVAQSSLMAPVQDVADGLVVFLRQNFRDLTSKFKDNIAKPFKKEEAPGNRSLGVQLQRSQAVLQKQAEEAAKEVGDSAGRLSTRARTTVEQIREEWRTQEQQKADSAEAQW